MYKSMSGALYFGADVIDIKRKPKPMKKPKMELYPIAKVELYAEGKVANTYWVVKLSDGTEVQCKDYKTAEQYQQEHKVLDKKEKV